MGDFAFATCLPGLEPALKREVARTRPELRAGTTRPGLVVFESSKTIAPDDAAGSVFARVWGRSIGAASDVKSAAAQLAGLGAARVHAFAREPDVPTDLARWQALGPGGAAQTGELVGDVVVHDNEPVWIGVHRHDATLPPHAGGTFGLAPSKIDEAIAWAQLSAPTRALAIGLGFARAGVDVTTVEKFSAVRDGSFDWLVVDFPISPLVALQEVARIVPRIRPAVGIFMLKVADWSFADDIPTLLARVRKLGYTDIRMRHLPSNRNDVCCVAR